MKRYVPTGSLQLFGHSAAEYSTDMPEIARLEGSGRLVAVVANGRAVLVDFGLPSPEIVSCIDAPSIGLATAIFETLDLETTEFTGPLDSGRPLTNLEVRQLSGHSQDFDNADARALAKAAMIRAGIVASFKKLASPPMKAAHANGGTVYIRDVSLADAAKAERDACVAAANDKIVDATLADAGDEDAVYRHFMAKYPGKPAYEIQAMVTRFMSDAARKKAEMDALAAEEAGKPLTRDPPDELSDLFKPQDPMPRDPLGEALKNPPPPPPPPPENPTKVDLGSGYSAEVGGVGKGAGIIIKKPNDWFKN